MHGAGVAQFFLFMDIVNFLIQLLNSVQYGLLLFMLAAGLTLIFGIMGVVNLAHGSFYMLGAYLAFSLSPLLGNMALAVVVLQQPVLMHLLQQTVVMVDMYILEEQVRILLAGVVVPEMVDHLQVV